MRKKSIVNFVTINPLATNVGYIIMKLTIYFHYLQHYCQRNPPIITKKFQYIKKVNL